MQVLVNGVAWCKIMPSGCSYSSCYRYFKELQAKGDLRFIFKKISRKKVNLEICSIDTTFIPSFEFKELTGWSGKDKHIGSRLSLVADSSGLPADVLFGKGSDNDKIFLPEHLENIKGQRKKVMNLDMMYMNLGFRREMR